MVVCSVQLNIFHQLEYSRVHIDGVKSKVSDGREKLYNIWQEVNLSEEDAANIAKDTVTAPVSCLTSSFFIVVPFYVCLAGYPASLGFSLPPSLSPSLLPSLPPSLPPSFRPSLPPWEIWESLQTTRLIRTKFGTCVHINLGMDIC